MERTTKEWIVTLFLTLAALILVGWGVVWAAGYVMNDLLGHVGDNNTVNFDVSSPNNATPTGATTYNPTFSVVDTVHHRLFVADSGNNRVLIFNLDANDTLVSHTADTVLGQSTFSQTGAGTSAGNLYLPAGLAYSTSTDQLFVADTGNNRVVIYDTASITNGEDAAHVLGQGDFTSKAAGTTQSTLSDPIGLAYFAVSSTLFVGDSTNNRVMVFDVSTITNGQNATEVLGQTSFTGTTLGCAANTFSYPYGLAINTASATLYVADFLNVRVVTFDIGSITNGQNATKVLGQANLSTCIGQADAQNTLNFPYGVAYDAASTTLYVTENDSNRVTAFNVGNISNNQNASFVLGQSTFSASSATTTQSGLNNPHGIGFNSTNRTIIVGDYNNNRVLFFSGAAIANGASATDVLGQLDSNGNVVYTTGFINGAAVSATGLLTPQGIALDSVNHRLFVIDQGNNRILVFDLDTNNNLSSHTAAKVLGQTDFMSGNAHTTRGGFSAPESVVYNSASNTLFVADSSNNRVLVFDVSTITNGMDASHVLGQANFTSATYPAISQNSFFFPTGLGFNPTSNTLFVADTNFNRVMIFNVGTITDNMNASFVLGEPNFISADGGTTQNTLLNPFGDIAFDTTTHMLYVADTFNNRVLAFDTTNLSNGQNASFVLGQSSFSASNAASTAQGLNSPIGVTLDSANSVLYAHDLNNNRVVGYNANNLSNGLAAQTVLGQTSFTTGLPSAGSSGLNLPYTGLFDTAHNRFYVADTNNNRIAIYEFVKLSASSFSNGTVNTPYTAQISSSNSQGTVAYTISSGSLPTGLRLSGSTISGTPTVAGTYSFTVHATDTLTQAIFENSRTYTITINEVTPSIIGGSLPPEAYQAPEPPTSTPENKPGGFGLVINDGEEKTTNSLLQLKLFGGPDATAMSLSIDDTTFTGASQQAYASEYKYDLCPQYCSAGWHKVYARFYTHYGVPSPVVASAIYFESTTSPLPPKTPTNTAPTTKPASPTTPVTHCFAHTFTKNLSFGALNSEVRLLQKRLNCLGFVLAKSGPGSPGHETNFFGWRTLRAVRKFQEKYRSAILTPLGRRFGTGSLDSYTRKVLNGL